MMKITHQFAEDFEFEESCSDAAGEQSDTLTVINDTSSEGEYS